MFGSNNSSDNQERFLKFGDKIVLFTDMQSGFLSTQGFTQPLCFVQYSPQSVEAVDNYRDFVFQVQPRLAYEALRDYQREKAKQLENQLEEQAEQAAKATESDDAQTKIKMQTKRSGSYSRLRVLRMRADQEAEMNKRTMLMKLEEIVTYGNQIQLMHHDSQGFISVSQETAVQDKSCNAVSLVENGIGSNIFFKILPRYKYRQEGEKVVYMDHIVLKASHINFSLHVSEKFLPRIIIPFQKSIYRRQEPLLRAFPQEKFSLMEVNSSMKLSKWQLLPHQHSTKDANKFIKGGDIIRLKHTELGGYLISEGRSNKDVVEVKCRVFKKEAEADAQLSVNSFFEVEVEADSYRGQFTTWGKRGYRLRHLNTGKLLTVTQSASHNQLILSLLESPPAPLSGPVSEGSAQHAQLQEYMMTTLFGMESTALDTDNRIRVNSCIKLKHLTKRLYVCAMKQEGLREAGALEKKGSLSSARSPVNRSDSINREAQEMGIINDQFSQIFSEQEERDDSNDFEEHRLQMLEKPRQEDAFTLIRCDDQEVRDVLYLHSCIGPLRQFLSVLRKGEDENDVSKEMFEDIEAILSHMIFFITDTEDQDPLTCEGIQRRHRQQCMRELQLIELLCDILYYPFQGERLFDIRKMSPEHPMTRICQLVYRLLKHTAKGYVRNILYEAQWIDLFFKEAMMTSQENDLMAEGTITELLSTNQELLDKQIKRKTIQDFIALCRKQRKNKRFMALLTALCSVNGQAVASNQGDICEILFDTERDNLMMPMRMNGDNVEVFVRQSGNAASDDDGEHIVLPLFKDDSRRRDGGRLYDYFVASLDLVAELCLDRNYKGINELDPIFPIEIVFNCMADQKYEPRLRAGFAKVFLYLHVDRSPLEPLKLPRKVRVWTDISKDPQEQSAFPSNKIHEAHLQLAKGFVTDYLDKIMGAQMAYRTDQNLLTLQILYLAEAMVRFGFYQTEQQLSQMVDPLITMLDGTLDLTTEEEEDRRKKTQTKIEDLRHLADKNRKLIQQELGSMRIKSRYQVNEKTLLIMQCKEKICDVLELVMSLQEDIRISRFLTYFKTNIDEDLGQSLGVSNKFSSSKVVSQSVARANVSQAKLKRKPQKKNTPLRWIDKVLEDRALDLEEISVRDFVAIMLDILLYERGELKNKAFSILVRFFTQRKALIDSLKEVQLLETPSSIETFRSVSKILLELKQMSENAEYWIGELDRNSVTNAKKTIKALDFLSQLCIQRKGRGEDDGDKFDSEVDFKVVAEPEVEDTAVEDQNRKSRKDSTVMANKFHNFVEKLKEFDADEIPVTSNVMAPDQNNQRLLFYLDAHQIAMILVKHKGLGVAQDKAAYLNVLKHAYKFLILYVRGNPTNQESLLEQLEPIQDDFSNGVNAVELLIEIFRNNPRMAQLNTKAMLKSLIHTIDNEETPFAKKAIFMHYLPVFMEMKGGRLFRNNQIDTLKQLTKDRNQQNLYNSTQGMEQLRSYIESLQEQRLRFQESEEQKSGEKSSRLLVLGDLERDLGELIMHERLVYYIELINVLATSAMGKNSVTEVMCQQLLSLECIKNQLAIASFCYPLKSVLFKYVMHVYLDIQKNMGDQHLDLIRGLMSIAFDDLKLFYDFKTNPLVKTGFRKLKLRTALGAHSVKRHLTAYIYEHLLPVLNDIFKARIDLTIDGRDLKPLMISITRHMPSLTQNQEYRRLCNSQYKNLVDHDGEATSDLAVSPRPHYEDLAEGDSLIPSFSKVQNTLGGGQTKGNLDHELLENQEVKYVGVMNRNKEEVVYSPKLTNLLYLLEENDQHMQRVHAEFEDLVDSIAGIKKKSEVGFEGTCTIRTEEIVESLIKLTSANNDQLGHSGNLNSLSQIEYGIRVLRRLVERENIERDTPVTEWETEDWIKFEQQIKEKQEMMGELGAVHLICHLLSHASNIDVKQHALDLAITSLLGGNHQIQMRFLDEMRKDTANEFILSARDLLTSTFQMIRAIEGERNRRKLKVIQIERRIKRSVVSGTYDVERSRLVLKKEAMEASTIDDLQASCEEEALVQLHPAFTNERNFEVANKILHSILLFLQLLCENHNKSLQDHLRQQRSEEDVLMTKNYDFVASIAIMLSPLHKIFNKYLIDLSMQMVETLTEFIQGPCVGNQKALLHSKIIDNSRDFIRDFEENQTPDFQSRELSEQAEAVDLLKMKIVRLVLSLLEGEADIEIIDNMASSLDYRLMRDRITEAYQNFLVKTFKTSPNADIPLRTVQNALRYDSFEGAVNEGFDLFILLNTLRDNTTNKLAKRNLELSNYTEEQRVAYEFFEENSARIEILNNGVLQRIYFPISPICRSLSKQSRRHLMETVNRDSAGEKVEGLMLAAPDFLDEMKHNEALSRRRCKITARTATWIRYCSFYIDLLINIILLSFYYRDFDNYLYRNKIELVDITLEILGFISVGMSTLVLLGWCLSWASLKIKARWREYAHRNKHLVLLTEEERKLEPWQMPIQTTRMLLHGRGPDCPELNLYGKRDLGNLPTRCDYFWISFVFLLEDYTFRYYIFYLAVAIAGVVASPLFFSIHLFDVVERSPTLINVIQSVTRNKDQLLMTTMLMIIILYIYAAFAFFYLQDTFYEVNINKYESTAGQNTCQNLAHCALNVIYFGLRMGGGMGDVTKQVKYSDLSRYIAKFFFDFTFFLIVIIIMLNILFGIIIDTFAQLRDSRTQTQDDMNNRCFICNIDRYTFDRYGGGFEKHIESDHSLWNYLYYIVHLQTKDPTDYSGVESYVAQKYKNDDISWVPLHRALCLDGKIAEEESFDDQVKTKLDSLEAKLKDIQTRLEE